MPEENVQAEPLSIAELKESFSPDERLKNFEKELESCRDAVMVVSNWDHTGEITYDEQDLKELQNAKQTLTSAGDKFSGIEAAKELLQTIDMHLEGFNYRREHKLAGLSHQVWITSKHMADALKGKSITTEALTTYMKHLKNQPEAQEIYKQLQKEWTQMLNILEANNQYEVTSHELGSRIGNLSTGLDFTTQEECLARLEEAEMLGENLEAVSDLFKSRDESNRRNQLIKALGRQVSRIGERTTNNLLLSTSNISEKPLWKDSLEDTQEEPLNTHEKVEQAIAKLERTIGWG